MKLNKNLIAVGVLLAGLSTSSFADKLKDKIFFHESYNITMVGPKEDKSSSILYRDITYYHTSDISVPDVLQACHRLSIRLSKDTYIDFDYWIDFYNDYDKDGIIGNHPKDICVSMFRSGQNPPLYSLSNITFPSKNFPFTYIMNEDFVDNNFYDSFVVANKNYISYNTIQNNRANNTEILNKKSEIKDMLKNETQSYRFYKANVLEDKMSE